MATKLKTIEKQVVRLDPTIEYGSEPFKTAVVVLASMSNQFTTSTELAPFTGYPKRFITTVLRRLKRNGLGWQDDGKFYHGGWLDKKTGGISFWMDVMVGQGLLQVKE